ncbi:MAG: energy-coupling factor transporter ATPase [Oscillospiraceae bacterium]
MIIDLENVSFKYSGSSKSVLEDISLGVKKGEFLAVLGYNGSGKSTLAKLMNGILLPSAGRVLAAGIDTANDERLFDIRRSIGMVFQNPDNQIISTTVEEDVAFALENLGVEPGEIRRRVDAAIEAVGLAKHATDAPHKLSGGQKQRVAIAGILAMSPECIILDEPTAMLDPKGRKRVMEIVRELNRQHEITVVLITHFMEEAAAADRLIVLSEGKIAMEGTPGKVFSNAAAMRKIGLDVPPTTQLCSLLADGGIRIRRDIVTPAECVNRLAELLGRQK